MRLYDNELEYLKSTGKEYINTEYVYKMGHKIIAEIMTENDASSNRCYFGAGNGTTYGGGDISLFYYDSWYECCYPTAENKGTYFRLKNPMVRNEKTLIEAFPFKITVTTSQASDTYDIPTYEGFVAKTPMYLFCDNRNGAVLQSKFRLYSFKIVDEIGKAVLDLIPVAKDGVGYMYDKVSGKLFGNSGNGEFVLGPVATRYQGQRVVAASEANASEANNASENNTSQNNTQTITRKGGRKNEG